MINELRLRGGWMFVVGWAMVLASLRGPLLRQPFPLLPFDHTPVFFFVVMAPAGWANPRDLTSILFPVPDLCLVASPLLFWLRPRRSLLDAFVRAASLGLLIPWLLPLIPEKPGFGKQSILDELMWGYYVFSAGCTLIFIACVLGRSVSKALMVGRGFPIEPIRTGSVQASTGA